MSDLHQEFEGRLHQALSANTAFVFDAELCSFRAFATRMERLGDCRCCIDRAVTNHVMNMVIGREIELENINWVLGNELLSDDEETIELVKHIKAGTERHIQGMKDVLEDFINTVS